ncbi:Dabb family protein [Curtobacterium sp. RRHDQ10]|uniref:Dabb family protein n=1 Tax=Curtobacterium phyllosphaerae TaxID=3413379 RepID=UPI003BF419CF
MADDEGTSMSGVTHVVLVQWPDGVDRSAEADALSREHLPRIDGVRSVVSGPSISTEGLEGEFDWMLVVRFRDRDALAAYLPHAEHRPVADFIGAGNERVVVFDVLEDQGPTAAVAGD